MKIILECEGEKQVEITFDPRFGKVTYNNNVTFQLYSEKSR